MSEVIDALEEKQHALTQEVRAKQNELRAVAAELEKTRLDSELEGDISAVERKHGIKLLRPAGVDSEEGVNGQ